MWLNVIRKLNKNTTIEALTPDFLRKGKAYKKVVEANPDVILGKAKAGGSLPFPVNGQLFKIE